MDTAIHAQLMAQLCTPRFAELVLQVPVRHAGKGELSRKVINTISHADKMATTCGSLQVSEMMYAIAEKAFSTATAESYDSQGEGARLVIALISHAHLMGRSVAEVSDEMLDLVRPIVAQPLPTRQQDLDDLSAQQNTTNAKIRELAHLTIMERMRRAM